MNISYHSYHGTKTAKPEELSFYFKISEFISLGLFLIYLDNILRCVNRKIRPNIENDWNEYRIELEKFFEFSNMVLNQPNY